MGNRHPELDSGSVKTFFGAHGSRHPDGVAVSRHPDGVAVIPNLFRDLWNLERMAGFSVLVISAMAGASTVSKKVWQVFARKLAG
ncbi:MAG: hypothetical protein IJJ66_00525 [Treponema sp.]|nr:hypothetical protein [Treponema sp.]